MSAVLSVISLAVQANAPFISYICQRPYRTLINVSQDSENAGVLSVVYSLILQLLHFRPPGDKVKFDRDMLAKLRGNMLGWNKVLELLRGLLEHTPAVRYCIIHGLNELENGEGAVKCKDLLNVLFANAHRPESPFSMLFTTSGASEMLNSVIDYKDRASSDLSMQKVKEDRLSLRFWICDESSKNILGWRALDEMIDAELGFDGS